MPVNLTGSIEVVPIVPSTIETVDVGFFNWVNKTLDVHVKNPDKFEKVKVVWSGQERVFQIKQDKDLRDNVGTLVLPLISIERTGFVKDPAFKGSVFAHIPPNEDYRGGSIEITRQINQNKTAAFGRRDAVKKTGQITFKLSPKTRKVVYETISVPMPIYITLTYEVKLRSEYQQHMNQMIQPFESFTGGINYFCFENQDHKYEGFIQSDKTLNNNFSDMTNDERRFETTIFIKVLGYLIGADINQKTPNAVRRENAVEFKFNREVTVFLDKLENEFGGHYREH